MAASFFLGVDVVDNFVFGDDGCEGGIVYIAIAHFWEVVGGTETFLVELG